MACMSRKQVKAYMLGRMYGMGSKRSQRYLQGRPDAVARDGTMIDFKFDYRQAESRMHRQFKEVPVHYWEIGTGKTGRTVEQNIEHQSKVINQMICQLNEEEGRKKYGQLNWNRYIDNPCGESMITQPKECTFEQQVNQTWWDEIVNYFTTKGDKKMNEKKPSLEDQLKFQKDVTVQLRQDLERAIHRIGELESKVSPPKSGSPAFRLHTSLEEEVQRLHRNDAHLGEQLLAVENQVKLIRKFLELKECVVDGVKILVNKGLNVKRWVKNEGH